MGDESTPGSERPSLQIAELTIENFRTFRERTVIPFSSGAGPSDAIATFHGDNGSGKSNAIAALDSLFRVAKWGSDPSVHLGWDQARGHLLVSPRDRPRGSSGSTEISARFADERLGTLTMRVSHEGDGVLIERLGTVEPWFRAPFGAGSRPMAVLSASRRASWFDDQTLGDAIQPALAEALMAARVSRDPDRRARWRDFLAALAAVPAFAGMDISIDRAKKNSFPELTFEVRDQSVLGLEELSSGERQLVILFAGVLLAEAAIVAIEEPELSLDAKSQHLFRAFLARLVEQRRIDQAIIESHVPAFDGPQVIRFHRDAGGAARVARAPSETAEQLALTRKAREQNAERQWVTRDGYTELPEVMRQDLGLEQGGGLWFLKRDRWEAWPDRDVAEFLGADESDESNRA